MMCNMEACWRNLALVLVGFLSFYARDVSAWDNIDLELFDLVEEIGLKENFYNILSVEQVKQQRPNSNGNVTSRSFFLINSLIGQFYHYSCYIPDGSFRQMFCLVGLCIFIYLLGMFELLNNRNVFLKKLGDNSVLSDITQFCGLRGCGSAGCPPL